MNSRQKSSKDQGKVDQRRTFVSRKLKNVLVARDYLFGRLKGLLTSFYIAEMSNRSF